MKVLLVAPPKRGLARSEEHPPVGLGYLATALREIGQVPDIQDCIINRWDVQSLLNYIQISRPDIVGVTVFSQAMLNVKEIMDNIKRRWPEIITIVGGPHPTAVPEEAVQYFSGADYGILGEGEIPLKELVYFLDKGRRRVQDIPGLIWRNNSSIHWNPKVEYDNIDDFNFPAWDLIEPRRYFSTPNIGENCCVIHTSRGCPFGCEFCVTLGKKLRYRSLEHIYEEISFLHERYGINRFVLGDEGFPIDMKFAKSFCRYVISKEDNFRYVAGCGLRLNAIDDEMLELMKQAGFQRLFGVGIESGVPRVRELMKKNLTQEQLYRGVDMLNRHGFRPSGNFILGFPGETKEEMQETIRVALELDLWGASFTPFAPLPGSAATKKLIKNGELPEDFDFSRIDLDEVLYAPGGMSIEELDNMRKKAVFRFNIRPRMLFYHLTIRRFFWSIVKFSRIFLPSWMLPKAWRRGIKSKKRSLHSRRWRNEGLISHNLLRGSAFPPSAGRGVDFP